MHLFNTRYSLLSVIIASHIAVVTAGCDNDADDDSQEPPSIADVVPPDAWVAEQTMLPRHIHLTWQNDPMTTITVQWTTDFGDADEYTPRVWLARSESGQVDVSGDGPQILKFEEAMVREGSGQIYTESLLGEPADEFPSRVVEITELEPDTTYFYRCGSWDGFDFDTGQFRDANLSAVLSFTTAIEKSADASFRFVAAGDSRGGYNHIAANAERYRDLNAHFWIFSGDLTGYGYQHEWDDWFGSMQPILESTVLMPVQGNHEIILNTYYGQFALPAKEGLPEELIEKAWSFDYGNMHVVSLHSSSSIWMEDQLPWLEADLAAAQADPDIVWIIATFHHAAYSSSNHGSTERVQEIFLPVFEQYGVDLTFAGHDHNYERSHPIRNNEIASDGNGTIHVVAGGFFAPGYGNGSEWWTVTSAHGDLYNYVVIDVDGSELTAQAFSGDGTQVLDTFTLSK